MKPTSSRAQRAELPILCQSPARVQIRWHSPRRRRGRFCKNQQARATLESEAARARIPRRNHLRNPSRLRNAQLQPRALRYHILRHPLKGLPILESRIYAGLSAALAAPRIPLSLPALPRHKSSLRLIVPRASSTTNIFHNLDQRRVRRREVDLEAYVHRSRARPQASGSLARFPILNQSRKTRATTRRPAIGLPPRQNSSRLRVRPVILVC